VGGRYLPLRNRPAGDPLAGRNRGDRGLKCVAAAITIAIATALSGVLVALLVLATIVLAIAYYCTRAHKPQAYMWTAPWWFASGEKQRWYANLWFWWLAVAAIFVTIYVHFW